MLIGARSSRVDALNVTRYGVLVRSRRINDRIAAIGLSHVQVCSGLFWMYQAVLGGQIGILRSEVNLVAGSSLNMADFEQLCWQWRLSVHFAWLQSMPSPDNLRSYSVPMPPIETSHGSDCEGSNQGHKSRRGWRRVILCFLVCMTEPSGTEVSHIKVPGYSV